MPELSLVHSLLHHPGHCPWSLETAEADRRILTREGSCRYIIQPQVLERITGGHGVLELIESTQSTSGRSSSCFALYKKHVTAVELST